MFGEDYQKHKSLVMDAANEFYNIVHGRLNSAYNKSMTIAWALISTINVSLLMLMIFIQHGNKNVKKPVRKPRKVIPKKVE